jgi:hyperosmotically inducible periplasmic protein
MHASALSYMRPSASPSLQTIASRPQWHSPHVRQCHLRRIHMNNIRKFAIVTTIALGVALSGCNVFRGQSTAGQYVDDVSITTRVKADLLESHRVDGLDVNVDSKNGNVTLSGWASSIEESQAAASIARKTKGVKSVDNQLALKK